MRPQAKRIIAIDAGRGATVQLPTDVIVASTFSADAVAIEKSTHEVDEEMI